MKLSRQLLTITLGAAGLGALSTFGDWLWTHYIPDGAVVPGVVHGIVVFLALAAVLAWGAGTRRAWRTLTLGLPILGALLAAVFYPLAMLTGYLGGLLVTWAGMWLGTAWLQRRARGEAESVARTLTRGVLAAIGSGLVFWAISGIWTQPDPVPDYAQRFAYWTFAFLPGIAALIAAQPPAHD